MLLHVVDYGVLHLDRHIEVALQTPWTFRGASEKLDDDKTTKTRLQCSLYLLTTETKHLTMGVTPVNYGF